MRRLLLLLLLLGWTACASPDRDAPEAAPVTPEASALRVVTERIDEEVDSLNYAAHIAYPQLRGGGAVAERVNAAIRDSVDTVVHNIRPRPEDFTGDPEQDRWVVGEVQGDFTEPLLQADLFSTRLGLSAYTGGAHPNTWAVSLTYDLSTGEPVVLADLFRPDAAYLDTLSALATERLLTQRGDGWLFEEPIPPVPQSFPNFSLEADSLRLYFPPYAIAPYAAGESEAALPYTRLRSVLRPEGPVARLAE